MTDYFFKDYSEDFFHSTNNYESDEIVIHHATNQLNELVNLINHPYPVMVESRMWGSTILPTLVATEISSKSIVKVLDFGGGAGKQYIEISKALSAAESRVHYHTIEMERFVYFCKPHLQRFLGDRFNQTFFIGSSLPVNEQFDIVSCTSSLQYVPEWRNKLNELLNLNPQHVAIINTPINSASTYSRNQYNLKPLVIPQWVFGLPDLDVAFNARGYERCFYSTHQLDYPTKDTPDGTVTKFAAVIYTRPSRYPD